MNSVARSTSSCFATIFQSGLVMTLASGLCVSSLNLRRLGTLYSLFTNTNHSEIPPFGLGFEKTLFFASLIVRTVGTMLFLLRRFPIDVLPINLLP